VSATRWNPRYVAYAAAHGMSPGAMLARNADRPAGDKVPPFGLWNSQRIVEWVATFPPQRRSYVREFWTAHPVLVAQYDEWLVRRAKELAQGAKRDG
jgi:hypothetical protein